MIPIMEKHFDFSLKPIAFINVCLIECHSTHSGTNLEEMMMIVITDTEKVKWGGYCLRNVQKTFSVEALDKICALPGRFTMLTECKHGMEGIEVVFDKSSYFVISDV